jgi:hypothetical protein
MTKTLAILWSIAALATALIVFMLFDIHRMDEEAKMWRERTEELLLRRSAEPKSRYWFPPLATTPSDCGEFRVVCDEVQWVLTLSVAGQRTWLANNCAGRYYRAEKCDAVLDAIQRKE